MSSHDCKLIGTLDLVEPIDRESLEEALAQGEWEFSYEDKDCPVYIDEKNHEIAFDADFSGFGDHLSDEMISFMNALEPLLANGGTLEVMDFDTGDSEYSVVPHHLGPNPEERVKAQIQYAVNQLERFAEGLIEKKALAKIKGIALKSALKK